MSVATLPPPSTAIPHPQRHPQCTPAAAATHTSVLLRTMHPFPRTLSLYLPLTTTCGEVLSALRLSSHSTSLLRLYTSNGRRMDAGDDLSSVVATSAAPFIALEVRLSTLGGKGGFGSMLRAQGGKMSARKGEENNDSCRDLNGRRLSTVKEARALSAYLASAPQREAALTKAQSEKYAKLEKMLGRKPRSDGEFQEAAERLDDAGGRLDGGDDDDDGEEGEEGGDDKGEGSSSRTRGLPNAVPVHGRESSTSGVQSTTSKRAHPHHRDRLDDDGFLRENQQAVERVKRAAALAMAKKKAKAAGKAANKKEGKVSATGNGQEKAPAVNAV